MFFHKRKYPAKKQELVKKAKSLNIRDLIIRVLEAAQTRNTQVLPFLTNAEPDSSRDNFAGRVYKKLIKSLEFTD